MKDYLSSLWLGTPRNLSQGNLEEFLRAKEKTAASVPALFRDVWEAEKAAPTEQHLTKVRVTGRRASVTAIENAMDRIGEIGERKGLKFTAKIDVERSGMQMRGQSIRDRVCTITLEGDFEGVNYAGGMLEEARGWADVDMEALISLPEKVLSDDTVKERLKSEKARPIESAFLRREAFESLKKEAAFSRSTAKGEHFKAARASLQQMLESLNHEFLAQGGEKGPSTDKKLRFSDHMLLFDINMEPVGACMHVTRGHELAPKGSTTDLVFIDNQGKVVSNSFGGDNYRGMFPHPATLVGPEKLTHNNAS